MLFSLIGSGRDTVSGSRGSQGGTAQLGPNLIFWQDIILIITNLVHWQEIIIIIIINIIIV